MELLTPAIGNIFWTAIVFLALVFLLGKFAWGPILKAVNDREISIVDAINQAKLARKAEKSAAMEDIKNQIGALSVGIAEQILRQKLDNTDAQNTLVENYLNNSNQN